LTDLICPTTTEKEIKIDYVIDGLCLEKQLTYMKLDPINLSLSPVRHLNSLFKSGLKLASFVFWL
jgi:hypothetical protein